MSEKQTCKILFDPLQSLVAVPWCGKEDVSRIQGSIRGHKWRRAVRARVHHRAPKWIKSRLKSSISVLATSSHESFESRFREKIDSISGQFRN